MIGFQPETKSLAWTCPSPDPSIWVRLRHPDRSQDRTPQARSGRRRAARAAAGSGGGTTPFRLPAAQEPHESGRHPHEQKDPLPALFRGGAGRAPPPRPQASHGDTGASSAAERAEPALEPRLRQRRSRRGQTLPRPCDRRRLYSRGADLGDRHLDRRPAPRAPSTRSSLASAGLPPSSATTAPA